MRWFRDGLLGLLAFCVVVSVGSRLVTPAIPAIVALLTMVSLIVLVLFPNRRR